MKVEIFNEFDPQKLEANVKGWLKNNIDIDIKHIAQSESTHGYSQRDRQDEAFYSYTISIWYV